LVILLCDVGMIQIYSQRDWLLVVMVTLYHPRSCTAAVAACCPVCSWCYCCFIWVAVCTVLDAADVVIINCTV